MKILIVDDEVIVAKALARAFQSKGHQVEVAHAGEEGLERWFNFLPDAVLLDVVMPGLTGPQVIDEFKKNRDSREGPMPSKYDPTIILMTAHSGIKGREAALVLGAHEFVQKPFEDVFALVEQLQQLVDERSATL